MTSGAFANSHHFTVNQLEMYDIRGENQTINIITNHPSSNLLPAFQNAMACTSPNFLGQEIYLKKLHEHFCGSSTVNKSQRKIFLLHGMGGIGKTQICLKFCDQTAEYFSYIFWVDTTSDDTVIQSLKDIYTKLASSGTQAFEFSTAVVLQQISSLKSQWLMIFDNADSSPEMVEKYIPPGNIGNILITSRNSELRRTATHDNSMEVSEMNETTAIELLLKIGGLSHIHEKEAKQIVKNIYCLPLAIDMAGAYITRTKCTPNEFIEMYNKYRPKLLNDNKFQGSSKYNKSVYKTWEISIQKILEMSNNTQDKSLSAAAQYAISLLNICAFMHYENISQIMFERAVKFYSQNVEQFTNVITPTYLHTMNSSILNMNENREWNGWIFHESIGLLLSFSLIKRTGRDTTYNMHPLVQSCCEDRLSIAEASL
ncbi:P-loop containing nucleoside triphosphate hydrolase protein [Cyathus striatus]|nr:P-loop containing nucleoside triphosphate hydrolase protein [Cyathus striatus]